MSYYTVYDLIQNVKRKIHGGSVPSPVADALDEGRRNMIKKIRPTEMRRKAYLEQALYPKVDRYSVPDDLQYDRITDINKLSDYHNVDTLQRPMELIYSRRFAQQRPGDKNKVSINNENGVKYASIRHPRGLRDCQGVTINKANSLTENGTWNVGGNVVNLRLDQLNHVTRGASLLFDINSSSNAGWIENFTMDSVDLSDYLNTGAAFAWLSIPLPKEMTSVRLTLGSDPTNLLTDLYFATVNQPHDNNMFTDGWNLLKYMLNNLNTVGTPNPKDLKYIRVDFTTTGNAIPNCNLDAIMARKGEVYEVFYQSAWCVIDAQTRAWKKMTTTNGDILPLEEDTFQILVLETALVVQKNIYGASAGAKADVTDIQDELKIAYSDYSFNHTDESIEPSESSYIVGDMYQGYSEESLDSYGESGDSYTGY